MNTAWFQPWQSRTVPGNHSIEEEDDIASMDEDALADRLLTQFPPYGAHQPQQQPEWLNFSGTQLTVQEPVDNNGNDNDALLLQQNQQDQSRVHNLSEEASFRDSVSVHDKLKHDLLMANPDWDADEKVLWKDTPIEMGNLALSNFAIYPRPEFSRDPEQRRLEWLDTDAIATQKVANSADKSASNTGPSSSRRHFSSFSDNVTSLSTNRKDVDRQHWMPDQLCKQCYSCETTFTVFRRRHHCRLCGQVFCNSCSAYFVPHQKTTIRVCGECYKQVHQKDGKLLQPSDDVFETSESNILTSPVGAIQPPQTPANVTSVHSSSFPHETPLQNRFVTTNTSDLSAIITSNTTTGSGTASKLLSEPIDSVLKELQEQAYQQTSSQSLLSSDNQEHLLVGQEWDDEVTRRKSSMISQYSESSLYPSSVPKPQLLPNTPNRRKEVNKTTTSETKNDEEIAYMQLIRLGNRHLGTTAADHLEQLLTELLRVHAPILFETLKEKPELKESWLNTLLTLATRCCSTVDPNIRKGDFLDIRPYCKVKVIPGGSNSDCAYVSGIVFRKNVSHKKMAREVLNPRILLLSGGIEFTRTENRIASLDTLFEQEDKYMEILVGKILKLKPDVLLVGRSVSRRAQELLLKADVVLVQQVKSTLLARISSQTGATIVSSTDHVMNQFGTKVLGKCNRFRLVTFRDSEVWLDDQLSENELVLEPDTGPNMTQSIQKFLHSPNSSPHERQAALAAFKLGNKAIDGSQAVKLGLAKRGVAQTYIMLEGCPKHLGCTVILRGARKAALKQVKTVFRFLINVAYNLRLETCFFKERGARLRPDFHVCPKHVFSSSLCVDFGSAPNGRKVKPWNGSNEEYVPKTNSAEISSFDHQSILVTSVWMTAKNQCCPAEVKGICYYSLQDVSLGQFLRDSCFNLSLRCQNPHCKKSVLDHSLSFVHNDGLINIVVEELNERLPSSATDNKDDNVNDKHTDGDDDDDDPDKPIATWTYCLNCKKVVSPLVFISENTWKFSFGKFLEVFFYNRDTVVNAPQHSCSCNLQSSTSLYFGCGKLAARFTYEPINPYDVFVRSNLPFDESFHKEELIQRLTLISESSSSMFTKFNKHIEKVSREARSLFHSAVNRPEHLQTVLSELNNIGSEVDNAAKVIQEKIATVLDKCRREEHINVVIYRFAWFVRRYLFMLMSVWNEKLNITGQAISVMRRIAAAGSYRSDGVIGPNVSAVVGDPFNEELAESMNRLRQFNDHYRRYNVTDLTQVLPTLPDGDERGDGDDDDDFDDADGSVEFGDSVDADVLASRRRLKSSKSLGTEADKKAQVPTKSLGTRRELSEGSPGIQDGSLNVSVKSSAGGAVKSALTRFFNRGGKESDTYEVDLGIFAEGRPRLTPGVDGVVIPVFDEQWSSIIAYSLSSVEYAKQFKHFSQLDSNSSQSPDNKFESRQSDTKSPQSMGGMHTTIERKEIERRMLVRNKSHIKHTFRDYSEKGQVSCKFVCTTFWATQFHALRHAFLSSQDEISDGQACAPFGLDIEQSYIESLSSAYSWAASGGKSGASFARTSDDRFVIKCISRTELQMFLDCAPAYFEYLSKAFFHGLPTVLCKIVGVYQIGVHNRITGKRSMEQVAVMQNIFYNRKISKMFDLKGSLRGRFAAQIQNARDDPRTQTTASNTEDKKVARKKGGEIGELNSDVKKTKERNDKQPKEGLSTLLDGDFLEFTRGRPMPMTDRAKAVFQMSILNDTLFLSIINVLDYSILVGVDEENNELVVGIIDFMRQYDILKQMERVGKSLPMVVGSEAPTIIQPPLYKARFTNAMERYFMTVPSKWTTI